MALVGQTMKTINSSQRHLLYLVKKGQENQGGWAMVSKGLWPLMQDLDPELVRLKENPLSDPGIRYAGDAQLTPEGEIVLKWSPI